MSEKPDKKSFTRSEFLTLTSLGLGSVALLSGCGDAQPEVENRVPAGEEWRSVPEDSASYLSEQASQNNILQEAADGIAHHRKSPAALRVRDDQGNVLRGLELDITQQESLFEWGLSFIEDIEDRHKPASDRKMRHVRELFNFTTAKCYWDERWHQPIEKEEGNRIYHVFRDEILYGRANGLQIKGHPLVWTVRKAIPGWLDNYEHPKRLEILESHVRSLVRQGKGLVASWDLVNEMLWEPTFRNYLQRDWPHIEPVDEIADYIAQALQWVRDEDPEPALVINDYGLQVAPHEDITAKGQRERYVALAELLKERGSAPDAIGTQAHVGGWYTPEVFRESLDHLAEAGLPIQVTEFWAHLEDLPELRTMSESEQTDALIRYITDCYTIAFGHPAVSHFSYWGGGRHFFDENGAPTRVYNALYDLVANRWTTELSLQTDEEGFITFRGFHGDYTGRFRDKRGNRHEFRFSVLPGRDNRFELEIKQGIR
ncbi:endo-1,4-beta-xylanase [Halalkalibaculum sp. DA3122]|uniref:endo-1,4-beta-xylanase n=1 Tax=Halalkalibaculum sp. DA3122 TaxID=3373607 RepID=UPI003755011A